MRRETAIMQAMRWFRFRLGSNRHVGQGIKQLATVLALTLALAPGRARAGDEQQCRLLDLSFVPSSSNANNGFRPQIVAWLETDTGVYVDTVYITQATGSFGIGNRPGRFDFNSGPLWPYGRRITVFPVWAHKQPVRWPEVDFQNADDNALSHLSSQSSRELHFCRPVLPNEFDAMTCPSTHSLTDKGKLSATATSNYPPRNDLEVNGEDASSVQMFAMLNPFDSVSQPTPAANVDAAISYAVSSLVPPGNYVLWVEVSKEFDTNSTYNASAYPSPVVSFDEYGLPYRGQPSVVYRVPFTMGNDVTTRSTADYVGYGDPDGLDGNIRPPDSTISTDPGSGAARLALVSAGADMYRVRVTSRRELDFTPPDVPSRANVTDATSTRATLSFIAPGDDLSIGQVQGYEIRYRVDEPISDANFDGSTIVIPPVNLVAAGKQQVIAIDGLLPDTEYSVGIRAFDNCRNTSPLVVVPVTTAARAAGEVDACFIATAAYGSTMANDVALLRKFRSSVLAKTALGELAIEAYYTFGPPVAGAIGESELLRETARTALAPIVDWVRDRH